MSGVPSLISVSGIMLGSSSSDFLLVVRLKPLLNVSYAYIYIASIYIIFIIASLELRRDVLNSPTAAIEGLATAFREPPSGK